MSVSTLLSVFGFALCVTTAVTGQQETPRLSQDENASIPSGARVFIGPVEGGYDIYLSAAIHQKEVPIVVVADRSRADFELSGVTESDKAGWAKIVFWGNTSSAEGKRQDDQPQDRNGRVGLQRKQGELRPR
jgi:hypothetical protein